MRKTNNNLIILLLCMVLLFLTGCTEQTGEIRTADDSIRLSNILFEGMEMNAEQNNTLQIAKEINAGAAFDAETHVFTVANTSGQTLKNVSFMMVLYNDEGVIVDDFYLSIDEWEPGSAVCTNADTVTEFGRAELASEIACGDTYVRTAFEEVNAYRGEKELEVSFERDLPASFQIGDSIYTLFDFAFYATGSYSMGEKNYMYEFKLKKISGSDDSELNFAYRFVGDDGIVYGSESFYGGYMEEGETIQIRSSNTHLPKGRFKIVLFGDNVRPAA